MQKYWIGVDLDGTLAHYDGWKGVEHIGMVVLFDDRCVTVKKNTGRLLVDFVV